MTIPLLTAHWRNLVVATFAAPDALLAPHLAPGLDLDRREGRAHCSLVGFQFQRPAVWGVPSPFFRDFPEWNLRIYVRRGGHRGVQFVREFVPHRLVAWAGRATFGEPFETAPVSVRVTRGGGHLAVDYTVSRGGRTHRLSAAGAAAPAPPDDRDRFFNDVYRGFGRGRGGGPTEFRVARPAWEVHPLRHFHVDVGWALLYGPEWAAMDGVEPESVALVRGSEVRVGAPHPPARAFSRRGPGVRPTFRGSVWPRASRGA